MRIYFTADPHFGHHLVTQLRGFATPGEHDEAVLSSYRDVLSPEDQLWILGDLALQQETHALELIDSLPGQKHLIAGNHDSCHPMHRDAHRRQRKFLEVFASVQSGARRRIAQRDVLLSHFPYAGLYSPIAPGPWWRPTEYDGYFANQDGEIRGKFGRVLKSYIAGAGYEYVTVSFPGKKTKHATIHSLVCGAFHGPRPVGMQACHNDGDKLNNRATNLRWDTPAGNSADRLRHGTMSAPGYSRPGEANPVAKLSAQDAAFIRQSDAPRDQLAKAFDVSVSTVHDIQKSRTWVDKSEVKRSDHVEGDRYVAWRLQNVGSLLLHGHTHSSNKITSETELHVGWDAWRRPVSLDEVATWVMTGQVDTSLAAL